MHTHVQRIDFFITTIEFYAFLVYNMRESKGIWVRAFEKPNYFGANASQSDKFGVFCTVIFTPPYTVGVPLLYIESNGVLNS